MKFHTVIILTPNINLGCGPISDLAYFWGGTMFLKSGGTPKMDILTRVIISGSLLSKHTAQCTSIQLFHTCSAHYMTQFSSVLTHNRSWLPLVELSIMGATIVHTFVHPQSEGLGRCGSGCRHRFQQFRKHARLMC